MEPVTFIELKDTLIKEGKEGTIKEISNKLDIIEKNSGGVNEKV